MSAEYDEDVDLPALVRFHGANDAIDAVLTVAVEAYGSPEAAVLKVHALVLARAAHVIPPVVGETP